MTRHNESVARLLEHIAELLSIKGESPFRIRAYQRAAREISGMADDIDDRFAAGTLEQIPGVGEAIAKKISEYLETGTLRYYEDLKRQVPLAAANLLDVPTIGPARAHLVFERLGITSASQLADAARSHQLASLPGFGKKLETKIAREAERVAKRTRRMLLGTVLPLVDDVVEQLRAIPTVTTANTAGSIRRRCETIGDIDVLAASDSPRIVVDAFTHLSLVAEVLATGPTRPSILTHDDLQIDLRVIHPDVYGSTLQYFTGSKEHNIALRGRVSRQGYKLSEYGLFDEQDRCIASRTEEDIYHALEMDWMPPELRENRGEIEAARAHRLPHLITEQDVRGDLHVHSEWSDGHDSMDAMVDAAIALGYTYLGFADHSPSLSIAHGLTVERVVRQREEIDELNRRYAPFRILHGAEVNILPDGELDYPDDVLSKFDLVIAAIHSHFDLPMDRMTARVLTALSHPMVTALGHPTGRLLQRRAPIEIDMDSVLSAAKDHGVALEINGQPDRLDLNDVWSRRARDAGISLVCSSDAHNTRQLSNMRYAIATARRGWVVARDVINTRSVDELLAGKSRSSART